MLCCPATCISRSRTRSCATFLGDTLDTDRVEAHDAGVLTLRIPVAEKAKPRKIEINAGNGTKVIDA